MKVISVINHVSQQLAARLYTRNLSPAHRQRGASALEYIVLAAVIIVIIAVVANSGTKDIFKNAFTDLFGSATAVGDTTGGGGGS